MPKNTRSAPSKHVSNGLDSPSNHRRQSKRPLKFNNRALNARRLQKKAEAERQRRDAKKQRLRKNTERWFRKKKEQRHREEQQRRTREFKENEKRLAREHDEVEKRIQRAENDRLKRETEKKRERILNIYIYKVSVVIKKLQRNDIVRARSYRKIDDDWMQNFMNVYFLNVEVSRDLNNAKLKKISILVVIKLNHWIDIKQRVNMSNLSYEIWMNQMKFIIFAKHRKFYNKHLKMMIKCINCSAIFASFVLSAPTFVFELTFFFIV